MGNFSVTKKTVDTYQIKDERGSGWTISIQSTDNTLDLTIVGERVSWHHYWGACGRSGYCSLADLLNTKDYLKAKFGVKDILDPEATIDSWIKQVLKDRRSGDLTSDEARVAYDPLVKLKEDVYEYGSYYSKYPLAYRYYELPLEVRSIIGDSPKMICHPNPDFEHFFYKVLNPLIIHLTLNYRTLFATKIDNATPVSYQDYAFNHEEASLWLHIGNESFLPVYPHISDVFPRLFFNVFGFATKMAVRRHKESDVAIDPICRKDDLGLLLLSLCDPKGSLRHLSHSEIGSNSWVKVLKLKHDMLLGNDPGSIYIKVINALLY